MPARLGDAEEPVRVGGGPDRVDRDLHAAVGAVLEADRHRARRGQLAVHLALGRAGADRAPRDEVGDELRCDRVEELAPGRQPQLGQVEQQPAAHPEAGVDGERAVEGRIVDEALPAHRRARLLEVDAHDEAEVGGQIVGEAAQALRVVERGDGVVDRARTGDDDEPVVLAAQDARDLVAAAADGDRRGLGERQLLEQDRRGQQWTDALDSEVAGPERHGGHSKPGA
jgi:cobaltochelatase CobN